MKSHIYAMEPLADVIPVWDIRSHYPAVGRVPPDVSLLSSNDPGCDHGK